MKLTKLGWYRLKNLHCNLINKKHSTKLNSVICANFALQWCWSEFCCNFTSSSCFFLIIQIQTGSFRHPNAFQGSNSVLFTSETSNGNALELVPAPNPYTKNFPIYIPYTDWHKIRVQVAIGTSEMHKEINFFFGFRAPK